MSKVTVSFNITGAKDHGVLNMGPVFADHIRAFRSAADAHGAQPAPGYDAAFVMDDTNVFRLRNELFVAKREPLHMQPDMQVVATGRSASANVLQNESAIPVLQADLKGFLKELGRGMCAIAVKADYQKPLDAAAIKAVVDQKGGHLIEVRETHLYAWANAAAIKALQKLPDIELVTPYRNWSDAYNPPIQIMQRPDVTMRPGPQ